MLVRECRLHSGVRKLRPDRVRVVLGTAHTQRRTFRCAYQLSFRSCAASLRLLDTKRSRTRHDGPNVHGVRGRLWSRMSRGRRGRRHHCSSTNLVRHEPSAKRSGDFGQRRILQDVSGTQNAAFGSGFHRLMGGFLQRRSDGRLLRRVRFYQFYDGRSFSMRRSGHL